MKKQAKQNVNITVLGLGYVGLPLALELAKFFKVSGFDNNKERIKELNKGIDITKEITKKSYFSNSNIKFTNDYLECKNSNIFIITVPTPVNNKNEPDLKNLKEAPKLVEKKKDEKSKSIENSGSNKKIN